MNYFVGMPMAPTLGCAKLLAEVFGSILPDLTVWSPYSPFLLEDVFLADAASRTLRGSPNPSLWLAYRTRSA